MEILRFFLLKLKWGMLFFILPAKRRFMCLCCCMNICVYYYKFIIRRLYRLRWRWYNRFLRLFWFFSVQGADYPYRGHLARGEPTP